MAGLARAIDPTTRCHQTPSPGRRRVGRVRIRRGVLSLAPCESHHQAEHKFGALPRSCWLKMSEHVHARAPVPPDRATGSAGPRIRQAGNHSRSFSAPAGAERSVDVDVAAAPAVAIISFCTRGRDPISGLRSWAGFSERPVLSCSAAERAILVVADLRLPAELFGPNTPIDLVGW